MPDLPDQHISPTPDPVAQEVYQDPVFQQQVQRLHRLTVYGRWIVIALLWVCIAPLCLWNLRAEIALWSDYFTWTAVRYGLAYHRLAAAGLALCVGTTVAVLIWQSCNILMGVPPQYAKRLEKQVLKIRQQGRSHPLWKRVCQP